ncbi:MAG: homoaconitate hydratase family protein [Bacteroidetes bacterium]|nr:homoaconitate hydratase family protein [Bacteroidota bacterium]
MTIIEKILSSHSDKKLVKPGDIVDVEIDARVARDFGGANVVKNIRDNNLGTENVKKTFFTFDCNPTGSDQKYATNQHICRVFARDLGIRVYDINSGIGTHLLIEEGLVYPGCTAISTDSHANILGAIGAFGQGMGDKDIAAAWSKGKIWFKVPKSVKINFLGNFPEDIFAKDIVLNLLAVFGANKLLGYSVEIYGDEVNRLSLDDRITISSMATEMGAIIIFFTPGEDIIQYCEERTGKKIKPVLADENAEYEQEFNLDVSRFISRVSKPGKPHDTADISDVVKTRIDSVFIGSCTNGRMEDMRVVANILKGKKVAPGVVLKIVPSTDKVWDQCLAEGLIDIFKSAGALVSNAGCAGCAAGQVGQNGPGEATVSTGNRNFPGKQGKGDVYLASPAVAAASALAGYITTPDKIPEKPAVFEPKVIQDEKARVSEAHKTVKEKPTVIKGRTWLIRKDNIDTDMIFHNRYLAITDIKEMGKYTFDNLEGYEDFAEKAKPGDIIITEKNFGSGSSRQQAVDCFKSLGIRAILAESFGAIYERNAINAAFPILIYKNLDNLELSDGDNIRINLKTGEILNLKNNKRANVDPFSEVQMEIYQNGGLF